ncbi:MAG: hypothetical protein OHK0032_08940 [Thermodesulfovibrionales bacterium]
MMNKEKATVAGMYIAIFLSVFLGILPGYLVDASETDISTHGNVAFEWTSTPPGQRVAKVTTETEIAIPFKVRVKGDVSKIKFLIPKKFMNFGIRIKDEVVSTKNGISNSTVLFNVPRGMPLGRHDLVILIIDPMNNREIGSGTVPFILLPQGIECMC